MGSLKCDLSSVINHPATWPAEASAIRGATAALLQNSRYAMPELIGYLQGHFKFDNGDPVVLSSR